LHGRVFPQMFRAKGAEDAAGMIHAEGRRDFYRR
jgi:hypothetical protein